MKSIKIMLKDTKKKAFTLIELLIVVAIIGILAGVGVPMYNGYMASAKIESSKTNHSNIKSFVAASLTRCSTAGSSAEIPLGTVQVKCDSTLTQWATLFATYFNDLNKNPYGGASSALKVAPGVGLDKGVTGISAKTVGTKKYITIRTKIDDTNYVPGTTKVVSIEVE